MSKCRICDAVFKTKTDLVIHTARTHTAHDTLKFLKVLNDYLNEIITTQDTTADTMNDINQIRNFMTATNPNTYTGLIKIKDNLQRLPKTEKYKAMYDEYENVLYAYMNNIKPVIDEIITSATNARKYDNNIVSPLPDTIG